MSIVVGILANIIRDNMTDAETTLDDWREALTAVEGDE